MSQPPELSFEDVNLTDLIDVSILQKMQNSFAKMARMASLTADENGVAVTAPSNFTELCTKFCRTSPIGKARCENCDKLGAVMTLQQKKPVSYRCHADLVDFAAPIMLGDRMIGSFIGGQVLPEEPNLEKMRQIAREIEVDEEEFIEAAKKTQIIPQAAIDRSTEFLYEFARIISDMAYNSYVSKELSQQAMMAAMQKSDFLANMSHEIRTPMNAVLGMAEMALREEMSPDAREYIRQIQSSGKHLLVIINDILDFSKIDSGKMEIIETTYKPESLIEDISHLVNSRIGTKDLDFLIDIPYDLPLELIGDNIRIQQVLVNLLTNAIKFTPRGKITLRLSHTSIDENSIMIHAKVEDTGNGIKKEDLNKLFESFQQVDSKRNRNIEGTGLGLAISKQLMQLMNGTISVSSEYGKGSIFSIDFPQKIFQKAPKIQISEQYPAVYILLGNQNVKEQLIQDLAKVGISPIDLSETNLTGTGKVSYFITERSMINCNFLELARQHGSTNFIVIDTYNGPNDLKAPNIKILRKPVTSINLLSAMGIGNFEEHSTEKGDTSFAFTAPEANILIVDDNHVNLTVAKGLLEPLHMKIDLADSAAECIEQIKQKTYDIIFMDHMMPEVDGIETTHIIRRMIPGYENVPIIALTANAVGGAREMFLQEGMNDFLAKPIETGKIVAMVKKWLPEEKIMPIDKSAQAAKTGMPCSCKMKGDTVLDQLIENRNLFPGGSTLLNDLATEGLNVSSALALVGTEKLYLQIVKEYYLAIDKHAELIEKAYQEKRIKDYVIEVHSLKSSSKQIGADSLSAYAALLEKAGNENDLSLLQYGTPALLEDLRKLQNSLRPLFPELNTEKTLPTADKNAILQCLSELQEALNTMDTLAIDEAMDKFHGFDYESQTTKKYLEQLTGAAEEFDIDSCLEIAAAWKEELESE